MFACSIRHKVVCPPEFYQQSSWKLWEYKSGDYISCFAPAALIATLCCMKSDFLLFTNFFVVAVGVEKNRTYPNDIGQWSCIIQFEEDEKYHNHFVQHFPTLFRSISVTSTSFLTKIHFGSFFFLLWKEKIFSENPSHATIFFQTSTLVGCWNGTEMQRYRVLFIWKN